MEAKTTDETVGRPLAVVTGAAHRLGRAIALALAGRGYAIGLHYHRSGESQKKTRAEIEALSVPCLPLQADLTDPAQIGKMFERVADSGLKLQVLVNSAGVMKPGSLREMSVDSWDETMALNLRAPWLCSAAAARLMGAEGGIIINVTDAGAGRAWTKYPAYILSKSGLETLTRLLARSLAPAVRVNAVAPGLILPAESLPAEEWNWLVQRLPLKRAGSPEEIAQAVLFLVEHNYMTGQTLTIDGGYQLIS